MIFTVVFPIICIACLGMIVIFIFPLPFSFRVKVIRNASRLFKTFLIILGIQIMFFIQEFLNQKGLRGQLSGKNQTSGNKNFIASNYFRHQRNMYLISIGIVLCIIVLTLTRVSYIFANQHNFLLEQHKKKQMEEEQKETKENTDEVNKPKSE